MLDIDHFKAYNDHYGHQGGDDCLARVAAQAQKQIRAADLLARYGGEEFAVVMIGASSSVSATIAERIRAQVETMRLPHAGAGGHVTLSIGAASMVPRTQNAQRQLIERADQCLYEAKRAGRNRIACAA
jgi:diguanylate cyclase (GGDEF)-like protein